MKKVGVERKTKYKPSRDIPQAIEELKSLSPSKISEWVKTHRIDHDQSGMKVQAHASVQSISNWIHLHPQIIGSLKEKLQNEGLNASAVSSTNFSLSF
jgi:hypothetical protein